MLPPSYPKTVSQIFHWQLIKSVFFEHEISRVFSANTRWIPRSSGRKAWLQLHPDADKLAKEVQIKFSEQKDEISLIKPQIRSCTLVCDISLPREKVLTKYGEQQAIDLSNMWPVIENGIKEGINVDDYMWDELRLKKVVSPDDKYYLIGFFSFYGVES